MWRLIHKIATGLIVALGALHCAFTAQNHDSFSLDAMWFLGSGVAIILAGFLNVAALRIGATDRVVKYLCLAANLFFTILFGVALFLLAQPQVIVGLALFLTATIAVFLG